MYILYSMGPRAGIKGITLRIPFVLTLIIYRYYAVGKLGENHHIGENPSRCYPDNGVQGLSEGTFANRHQCKLPFGGVAEPRLYEEW